jgi:hypothetical protein
MRTLEPYEHQGSGMTMSGNATAVARVDIQKRLGRFLRIVGSVEDYFVSESLSIQVRKL